jgi:hypothetical protein
MTNEEFNADTDDPFVAVEKPTKEQFYCGCLVTPHGRLYLRQELAVERYQKAHKNEKAN